MKQHLIVLSTGRTGTKFLSRIFTSLGIEDISHQGNFSRTMNIVGNIGLCSVFEAPAKIVLQYLLNKTDRMRSTVDPLLSIPHILLANDHKQNITLKFLHIIRDPRDFATSFMNWRRGSLRRMFLHHCVPFWQPTPWCIGDISLKPYLKISKFEHFCWIWAFKNNLFFKKMANSGFQYLLFRFEDLTILEYSSKGPINTLASFLEIPISKLTDLLVTSKAINVSSVQHFPNWKKWTKQQAMILDKHCGPLMKKYSYGTEPEWQQLVN